MEEQWLEEPPTQLLVAAYMGVKRTKRKKLAEVKQKMTQVDVDAILSMFPDGKIN